MSGWISIHRKLLSWEWYTDSHMVHLALHLLLKANHTPKSWKGIVLARGQLITSRRQISIETGVSEQTLRSCLSRLAASNFLKTKSTNKFTLITITKYDDYQALPQPCQPAEQPTTNQQSTSNQPATNQQLTTNNNNNKENNENNFNNENKKGESLLKKEISKKNETATQKNAAPDFDAIVEAYHQACPAMPRVKTLHETRKKNLRLIISRDGEQQLREAFSLAGKSDFLTGQNDRGWTADFDWIIKTVNFYKILEGKYTNPKNYGKFKPTDPRASQAAGWGIPL